MLKKTRPRQQNHRPQRNVHSNGSHGVDPREDVKLKNKAFYQQNFDKYTNYAKEALRSGDRIDAENFFQHAEHYLRFLNERIRYDQEQQALQNQRNNQPRHPNQNNHHSQHKNTSENHSSNHQVKRNPIIDSLNEELHDSKKEQYKQKIENAINDSMAKDDDSSQSEDLSSQNIEENTQKQNIKKRKFLKNPSSESREQRQKEEGDANESGEVDRAPKTSKPKLRKKIKETEKVDEVASQTQEGSLS